ncbi:MAG TPA: response regulator transcription factor, partial [Bryobacteraceae bacterium]|nr:response regulator transcription factor [Bryobacteraceae bacterium]
EKILLVTGRPLLSLTFRELLDSAGWDAGHIVLAPEELPASLQPDTAALLVIDSEGGPSWDTLAGLCRQSPLSRFVVWCPRVTPPSLQAAIESGVHGLLSIRLPIPEAGHALTRIWQGERQFRFDGDLQPSASPEPVLTPREQQVVALVMEGRRNREIAEALHTTEGSVKVYMNRIFWKTGAKTRHELALTAHSVSRRREAHAPAQSSAPGAPQQFDAAWMFTASHPDFRSKGDPSYDSSKR